MSSTSNKRHKYTAQFKLRVVQFAEKSSNSKAGREFGVNEKLVRDWRRNVDKLQSMPRKKCADRGKKCYWPALEDEVVKWVTEQRQDGYIVTRNLIRLHAQVLAQKWNVANFSGTNSWCTRFMKRRGLAIRQKTKIAQKLPKSLLVWDSFSAHLGDSAKQLLKGNRSTQAVIPGGLTSLVQPLDVCLNKPFKDRLREK